jgi:regulator of replication initiation timing
MRKSMMVLALATALVVGACGGDVTASDEYQALQSEIADLDRQLSDRTAELAAASDEHHALELEIADLDRQLSDATAQLAEAHAVVSGEIPAEVLALLDEWWAANERKDGSVVDLYTEAGYHLYGQAKYSGDDLVAHLQLAVRPEWITEPYLIVADQSHGRYVVTRGMRSGAIGSAVTFEVVTTLQGELKLAQTAWALAHPS